MMVGGPKKCLLIYWGILVHAMRLVTITITNTINTTNTTNTIDDEELSSIMNNNTLMANNT
jgi:hypothetical protein